LISLGWYNWFIIKVGCISKRTQLVLVLYVQFEHLFSSNNPLSLALSNVWSNSGTSDYSL
jgi:hypothetical protein